MHVLDEFSSFNHRKCYGNGTGASSRKSTLCSYAPRANSSPTNATASRSIRDLSLACVRVMVRCGSFCQLHYAYPEREGCRKKAKAQKLSARHHRREEKASVKIGEEENSKSNYSRHYPLSNEDFVQNASDCRGVFLLPSTSFL